MELIRKNIALVFVVIISTLLTIIGCFDIIPGDEIVTLIVGVLALIPQNKKKTVESNTHE